VHRRRIRHLLTVVGVNLAVAALAVSAGAPSSGTSAVASPAAASVGAAAVGDRFGDAADLGSMRGTRLAQPVVGMAATPSGKGYWLVARDGGIFSFGDARFLGSTGAIHLNQPIVGITRTPTGKGYWFVAADGGIFSYGDARFFGSTGALRLNKPIVGMAATPTGKGYRLVASDGGIFSFGDARFLGSTGATRLNQPIVGISSTKSGSGYWLVTGDGAIYAFGDAKNLGSAAGRSGQSVVGMAPSTDGAGYWLGAADGAVFPFGAASTFGPGATTSRVVGITPTPTGKGYWLVAADGDVISKVTAPVTTSTVFAFLRQSKDGGPVRYDPCTDQHFVINQTLAPAGSIDEVKTAFQRLGTTLETHLPFGERKSYQPTLYGNRWAPILISWSNEAVEPLLAGGTLGYGGSTSYWAGSSDEAYVTGEVVFDTVDDVLRAGFGPGLTRGNLEMHEIGHVAGLDHVADRTQLMNPSINVDTPDGYGAGDLAGLVQLGSAAGCLTVAKPTALLG
jgi:ribosomal protein L24E